MKISIVSANKLSFSETVKKENKNSVLNPSGEMSSESEMEHTQEEQEHTKISQQPSAKSKEVENPTKGTLFYIAFTLFNSFCYVFAELLYQRTAKACPDCEITANQLLVLRSTFATFIMICLMNNNTKAILYDGCGKNDVFPVAFRSVQGTLTNIINFVAAKYI